MRPNIDASGASAEQAATEPSNIKADGASEVTPDSVETIAQSGEKAPAEPTRPPSQPKEGGAAASAVLSCATPADSEAGAIGVHGAPPLLSPESACNSASEIKPPTKKGPLRKSMVEPLEVETAKMLHGGGTPVASLSSSIVNMANTVMGVGLLALPRAFAHSGMVCGLLLTIFAAVLNVFTCHLIARCQDVVGRPCTFRDLADRAFPYFSVVIDLSVLVLNFGSACSYLIVATNCFQFTAGTEVRWIWTLVALALVAPLSFLRSLDSLRFSSAAAVAILLFMTLVIVLFATHTPHAPLIDACGSPTAHNDSCPPGPVAATQPILPTLSAFSSLSLAFSCQATAPIIGNEMVRPTSARLLAVFVGAIGLAFSLYVIVAVSGYSTFGDRVQANILDSYPENGLVAVSRIGLAFVVIFSYPIQTFVARLSVASLTRVAAGGCCPTNTSVAGLLARPTNPSGSRMGTVFEFEALPVVTSVAFLGVTTLVALTVEDLGLIVDLAGAIGATMVSFVAPPVLYIYIFPTPRAAPLRVASFVVAAFGVCSLILGVVLAVYGAVHHHEIYRENWAINVSDATFFDDGGVVGTSSSTRR